MNTKPVGDMYLAAALVAYNIVLQDIDRNDKKRQRFIFELDGTKQIFILEDGKVDEKEVDLDQFETLFTCNRIMLPPIYPDCIKKIKSALYADE